jgi:hypothetical protein
MYLRRAMLRCADEFLSSPHRADSAFQTTTNSMYLRRAKLRCAGEFLQSCSLPCAQITSPCAALVQGSHLQSISAIRRARYQKVPAEVPLPATLRYLVHQLPASSNWR